MAERMSVLSTEYRRWLVDALLDGVPGDPTTGQVEFAFTPTQTTPPSSWTAGSWETVTGSPTRYYARILVGPNGTTVAAGAWFVWIRVTYPPETIVRCIDTLVVS